MFWALKFDTATTATHHGGFGLASLKTGEQTISFVGFQKSQMMYRNTEGDVCCSHIDYSFLS